MTYDGRRMTRGLLYGRSKGYKCVEMVGGLVNWSQGFGSAFASWLYVALSGRDRGIHEGRRAIGRRRTAVAI